MSISPDTKDWTWVVGLRCPECGFDASTFPAAEVAARLRGEIAVWREVLRRPDAADRPQPGIWSALEYGCHIRDVCTLYERRLELMLTEDDPMFANWDQDETAVEARYGEQDPGEVLAGIEKEAERLASAFAAVGGDQWQRPGRRSDGAVFTVDTFARYLLHDVVHHGWDVTDRDDAG